MIELLNSINFLSFAMLSKVLNVSIEYALLFMYLFIGLRNGYYEYTGIYNSPFSVFIKEKEQSLIDRDGTTPLHATTRKVTSSKSKDVIIETVTEEDLIHPKLAMLLIWGIPFILTVQAYIICAQFFDSKLLDRLNHLTIFFYLGFHLLKRCIETIVLHRYSSMVPKNMAFSLSGSYAFLVLNICISSFFLPSFKSGGWLRIFQLFAKLLSPVLFMIGEFGTIIHYYILSKMRTIAEMEREERALQTQSLRPSEKSSNLYHLPQEGMFQYCVCPHYLFESLSWLSMALLAGKPSIFGVWFVITATLAGRSNMIKKWYIRQFDTFDKRKDRMIPFIY